MKQAQWNNVAIIGVGLIGGSIGLALRRNNLAKQITGIGRTESSLQLAQELNTIDTYALDIPSGVKSADLIIVCTPVGLIVDQVREVVKHCPENALITDAGSTKATIVSQLDVPFDRNVRFVGSHPIAGSEKSGPEEAREDLYDDHLVILTPTENSATADVKMLSQFWSSLGANVISMSPEEHDQALAMTSHLPHAMAALLALTTPLKYYPLSAGGFRDTTRIAGGKPEMWTHIMQENHTQILAALSTLEQHLAEFKTALQNNDQETLLKILQQAKQNRDALGS